MFTEKKVEKIIRTGKVGETEVSITFDVESGKIKETIQMNFKNGNYYGSANYNATLRNFSFQTSSANLSFSREAAETAITQVESILAEFNGNES